MAHTRPPGNTPTAVYDAIRNKGVIQEVLLPFTDSIISIEEYYSPDPLTEDLQKEVKQWDDKNDFGYEHIFRGGTIADKQKTILEALKTSRVAVWVYAWTEDRGIYYKPEGAQDNHWTVLTYGEEGKSWICDDSYPPYIKQLNWNYDFGEARRIYVSKRVTPTQKKTLLNISQILSNISGLLTSLLSKWFPDPETYKPAIPKIEIKDMTPEPVKIPIKPSLIPKWAEAIQKEEGYYSGSRSFRNKNPGNLRFSPLTKELGAMGKDKDNFCIFSSYEAGFKALCQFLTLAAQNQLRPYRDARTLRKFTKIYAQPTSDAYANNVAKKLGVPVDIDIGKLL